MMIGIAIGIAIDTKIGFLGAENPKVRSRDQGRERELTRRYWANEIRNSRIEACVMTAPAPGNPARQWTAMMTAGLLAHGCSPSICLPAKP